MPGTNWIRQPGLEIQKQKASLKSMFSYKTELECLERFFAMAQRCLKNLRMKVVEHTISKISVQTLEKYIKFNKNLGNVDHEAGHINSNMPVTTSFTKCT